MGDILIYAVSFILMGIGLLGCFVHKVPGPILTYIGILILHFSTGGKLLSVLEIILLAVIVVLAKIATRYIPVITRKIHNISRQATWGTIAGSLLGLILVIQLSEISTTASVFLWILSFMVFPYASAFLFEYIKNKNMRESLMVALASYLTYLMGTLLNVIVCGYCIYSAFSR